MVLDVLLIIIIITCAFLIGGVEEEAELLVSFDDRCPFAS